MTNAADSEQALAGGAVGQRARLEASICSTGRRSNITSSISSKPTTSSPIKFRARSRRTWWTTIPEFRRADTSSRNKLFYFGSYEEDYLNSAASPTLPNATMLSGNESGSSHAIYDPNTGDPGRQGQNSLHGET